MTESLSQAQPGGDIAARLAAVRARIAAAAAAVGRGDDITLVGVSKMFPPAVAAAAIAAGLHDLGESRAQELRSKIQELRSKTSELGTETVRWHFVGRLQRNKVRDVVGRVALLHSVDRTELVDAVAAAAEQRGIRQHVLVQVNAGNDPAKAGVTPDAAQALVAAVVARPSLVCDGLMTIPPLDAAPHEAFARLRNLRDDLVRSYPTVRHLSMGMSNDFEVAIACGATIVRVGEAVFGPRPAPAPPAAFTARRAR